MPQHATRSDAREAVEAPPPDWERFEGMRVQLPGPLSLAAQGYPMLGEQHVPVFESTRGAVQALAAIERFGAFDHNTNRAIQGAERHIAAALNMCGATSVEVTIPAGGC